jgi:ribonucleotide reductase alpha subunit
VCTGDHSVFVFGENDEHIEVLARNLVGGNVLATPVGRPAHASVRPMTAHIEKTFTTNNILEAESYRMVYRNRGCISYLRHIDNMWFVIPYIKEAVQKYEKNLISSVSSYLPVEETYVYDLTVDNDHTYVTHGGLVHNSGKRMGSIACYLEPWHSDIDSFIELRKNTGDENLRARDLFLALWVPDLFMKRVKEDREWSLMCPSECPGLHDTFGDAFEELYTQYETEKKYKRQVRARDLWNKILEVQIETGMPYISYKDHANRKSNQSNIGIIRSSNLCVAPETRVLTQEKGYVSIKTIENEMVHVWNGEEWSQTTIRKTSNASPLMKIEFSNGAVLECTPEHTFYVFDNKENVIQCSAKDLKSGMRLIYSNLPSIHTCLQAQHRQLFEQMKMYRSYTFDLNSTNVITGIYFKHENDLLIRTFYNTLLEYGIFANVYVQNEMTHLSMIPHDLYTLRKRTGFLFYEEYKYSLTDSFGPRPVSVSFVTDTGRVDETYCFTEEKRHMGVFNGILTGQCNEILEVANEEEVSVCNLASICLPRFVEHGSYNFKKLGEVVETVVENLNNVIDLNYYPIKETHVSNMRNRPIGLGVQGLADTYIKLHVPFDSDEASQINKQIFETIYYHAVKKSVELAKRDGPYERFTGSPASRGLLQFHMWNLDPSTLVYNWDDVVEDVKTHGIRNSLLVALMPTASTSQIMGCNEAFEPITSNLYVRKTIAGEFIVVNEHLVRDLLALGLWDKEMYEEILYYNGSIQSISRIPARIRELYKTAYEIKMVKILKQAVERGPFVDQTQSMNLFMKTPNFETLNNALFYGWTHGLKTGMYYLRTQPVQSSIKFGIDPLAIQRIKEKENAPSGEYCVKMKKMVDGKLEDCVMCSS